MVIPSLALTSLPSIRRTISLISLALSRYSSFFFRSRGRNRLTGDLLHRRKARGADIKTGPTLCAFLLVDYMDLILAADNRLSWALPETTPTSLALIRIDIERDQCLAEKCWAPLL